MPAADLSELITRPETRRLLEEELRRLVCASEGFKPFERLADFRFLTKPFEVGQELTATYKLKRHVITERYAPLIAEMYPQEKPSAS